MSENIFAQMLQRYSGDPAGWVRDMVGIEVDEWQASVMDQVAQMVIVMMIRMEMK